MSNESNGLPPKSMVFIMICGGLSGVYSLIWLGLTVLGRSVGGPFDWAWIPVIVSILLLVVFDGVREEARRNPYQYAFIVLAAPLMWAIVAQLVVWILGWLV